MKKVLFTLWYSLFILGAEGQVPFTLTGWFTNSYPITSVTLQGPGLNTEVLLSAQNEFHFKGTLKESGIVLVKTNHSSAWGIWIDSGNIKVNLEEFFLDSTDTSGKKNLRIKDLTGPFNTEKNQEFIITWNHLNKHFRSLGVKSPRDSTAEYFYRLLRTFVSFNQSNPLSKYLITAYPIGSKNVALLYQTLEASLSEKEKNHFREYFEREKLLIVGNKLENFKQPKLTGGILELYSLDARFILIEFWSSDCFPCRAQNSQLQKVYDTYRNKGLEIVGVSLDKNKKEWKAAVKKDKITWPQVSDLKGWQNALVAKYYIDAIPFNILINQSKKIIKTNLTPSALASELEVLMKN